jgi:cytochrome c oxidase subunit 2
MKIIVDTPEDYKKWLAQQATIASQIKEASAKPEVDPSTEKLSDSSKTVATDSKAVVSK